MIDQSAQQPSRASLAVCASTAPPISFVHGLLWARLAAGLTWLLVPLTLALAITRQSLWIDEGFTVWFASHRTFTSFWSTLVGAPGTPGDSQLMLYLLYMWGWIKLFGKTEWALRLANVPFALLFIATMSWAARHLLHRPMFWLFFCLSPFFWFYLNEARPYVMLLAFSSIATVALLSYFADPSEYKISAPWLCLVGLWFAWATHIMAAFLFPALFAFVLLSIASQPAFRRGFIRDWVKPVLVCSPAFLLLASFYMVVTGYGLNKYGKSWPFSLIYVFYAFLGFGGLGPPRNQLRSATHLAVFAPYLPSVLLGGLALLVVCVVFLCSRPPRVVILLAISFLIGIAAAMFASVVGDFQILDRHVAALCPLFLLTLLLWFSHALSMDHSGYTVRVALIGLALVWTVSDARLVFLPQYQKDSYRAAAAIALLKANSPRDTILWAADPHTAYYYGIRVMNSGRYAGSPTDDLDWPVEREALDARNWNAADSVAFLSTTSAPTVLVLSKADAFDSRGVWRALVAETKPQQLAQLNSFSIYEWQPHSTVPSPIASHPADQ